MNKQLNFSPVISDPVRMSLLLKRLQGPHGGSKRVTITIAPDLQLKKWVICAVARA